MPFFDPRLRTWFMVALFLSIIFASSPDRANCGNELSDGESVYVPIYSNVYSGPKKRPFQLAALLSIRNTDLKYPITILEIDYYDNSGKLVDKYIEKEFQLAPMESTNFYIKEYDKKGGPGANFIVTWCSEKMVNHPIIQGIMLGFTSGQGLSFVCPGQIIKRHTD